MASTTWKEPWETADFGWELAGSEIAEVSLIALSSSAGTSAALKDASSPSKIAKKHCPWRRAKLPRRKLSTKNIHGNTKTKRKRHHSLTAPNPREVSSNHEVSPRITWRSHALKRARSKGQDTATSSSNAGCCRLGDCCGRSKSVIRRERRICGRSVCTSMCRFSHKGFDQASE